MRNTTIQIRMKTSKPISKGFIDDIKSAIEEHHGYGIIESLDWREEGNAESIGDYEIENFQPPILRKGEGEDDITTCRPVDITNID